LHFAQPVPRISIVVIRSPKEGIAFSPVITVCFEDYARIFALDIRGNIIVYVNSFEECHPDLRLSFQILDSYFSNTLIGHADPRWNPVDRDLQDTPEPIGGTAGFVIVSHGTHLVCWNFKFT
jgi:hypothetical protein